VLEPSPLNIWARIGHKKNIRSLSVCTKDGYLISSSEIVVSGRHHRATNASDHVFGMLGLVHRFESLVYYQLSTAEVF
jgi:hypothetical protein